MTVNEIRDAREELEKDILQLCCAFSNKVGFSVIGCEIRSVTAQQLEDKYPRLITSAVSIELERI